MKLVEINENQKDIWNKFIIENNSESFLQSWEWGRFNQVLGKKMWRLGVVEDESFNNDNFTDFKRSKLHIQSYNSNRTMKSSEKNKTKISNNNLIAVALIMKYDLPFGWSYLYCPRGPVVSNKHSTSNILSFLFDKIKKIAKENKAIFLRIDPPIDYNIEYNGFKKALNEIQPKDTLMLDLEKSEEELLKEMKQKTRYNIRLSEKKGVKVFSVSDYKKYFSYFWSLTKETSVRDKFSSHNENYYKNMLENLNFCNNFNKENNIVLKKLSAKLYFAEFKGKIIASNIVFYFGVLCVYLHGASSNKYRNLMSPYLLQWKQIQDAKKAGCRKYDFWGITINDKKKSWKGITRFKKGFGGYEKSYIGLYDLVFSNIGYKIYKIMIKCRAILSVFRIK